MGLIHVAVTLRSFEAVNQRFDQVDSVLVDLAAIARERYVIDSLAGEVRRIKTHLGMD